MAKNYKVYEADLEKDFKEDPRNANKGTQKGAKMLETSIEKFGAARSMVADADGFMPAGNKTREALVAAGIRNAVVVETDGNTPVIVKRTDWHLNEERGTAREYAYADNRIGQVNLEWDMEMVAVDNQEIGMEYLFGDLSDVQIDLDDLYVDAKEKQEKMVLNFQDKHLTVEEKLLRIDKSKEVAILKLLEMA